MQQVNYEEYKSSSPDTELVIDTGLGDSETAPSRKPAPTLVLSSSSFEREERLAIIVRIMIILAASSTTGATTQPFMRENNNKVMRWGI
jgi:hypothetical protein